MIRLMIVDDETTELKCFCNLIDWEKYGFELCYSMNDSQRAYEMLKSEKVDVIISDIAMPRLSGIEFARLVKENYPNITFVFISAYKEFSYAQDAIKYNVFSYITKPFDYGEITDALNRIRTFREKSARQTASDPDNVIPFMQQQQAVTDLCCGIINKKEFENIFGKQFGNFDTDRTPVAVITVGIINLVDYLKNIWGYELDRLYACIIRYMQCDTVNFVPVEYAFDKIHLLASPKNYEVSADDFKNDCNAALQNFIKVYLPELKLDIAFDLCSYFPNIRSAVNIIKSITGTLEPKPGDDIIEEAKTYIRDNCAKPISLADVAKAVSLSPYHFSRIFKDKVGETVINYIIIVRLEKACELLLNTNMPVAGIAEAAGYISKAYFYRIFRKNYGMTPSEYRQQNRS